MFLPWWTDEIRVGANYRQYTPDSDGTIFNDPEAVVITNQELGVHRSEKRLFSDKLITTATIRMDYNENFPYLSPAGPSFGPQAPKILSIELSVQRFETQLWPINTSSWMLDQRPWSETLRGEKGSLPLRRFEEYRKVHRGKHCFSMIHLETTFDIDAIRPEQVRTLEWGIGPRW